ncbi:MAG TPA: EamA family transporter [Candidatus Limnocylindria bacterium]|nr:EamA family transporter [Candidatus Limnocylindria bacterium]
MPTGRGPQSTLSVAVALGTVYLVWGSTYLAIAYVVETLPPILSGGIRFLIAGSLLLAFILAQAWWRRRRDPTARVARPRLVEWRTAAIVGVFLLLGGNGLVSVAEQRIPSFIAAVIIATVPIWMTVGEAILIRRMPGPLAIVGLLVGLVGVAILLLPSGDIDAIDPIGVAIVVGSALSWTAGSLYARRAPLPANQLMGSGMEQLIGGSVMLGVAVLLGEFASLEPGSVSTASLLGLLYLIVFGSLIAFTAYVWLLEHAPITTVATYAYVNPVVAVFLGLVLRDEPMTPRTLLATALIIGAVVAMVSGRPRGAEEAGPGPEVAALEPADDAA